MDIYVLCKESVVEGDWVGWGSLVPRPSTAKQLQSNGRIWVRGYCRVRKPWAGSSWGKMTKVSDSQLWLKHLLKAFFSSHYLQRQFRSFFCFLLTDPREQFYQVGNSKKDSCVQGKKRLHSSLSSSPLTHYFENVSLHVRGNFLRRCTFTTVASAHNEGKEFDQNIKRKWAQPVMHKFGPTPQIGGCCCSCRHVP